MTTTKKTGGGVKQVSGKSATPAGRAKSAKARSPKAGSAAEAAKRLSKLTLEEQAAELFKTMIASSGKKS